ncbi:hypothetical protein GCM10009560_69420 [Nonomuraea longicatena]|uniref:Exo-alpha-sialidase n=1 Tax=Nonomuraea longicatena TaxID=83682 RepID=A0ABN1R0P9_9ACTN
MVDRPDKLVATGTPRPLPAKPEPQNPPSDDAHRHETADHDPPSDDAHRHQAADHDRPGDDDHDRRDRAAREEDALRGAPEHDELVHRVGGPPAGRPTRPDLLLADPDGPGRHHRAGPAPAAIRRAGPMGRRRQRRPVLLAAALAVVLASGVIGWRWWGDTGLRLEQGTGHSGDELFTVRGTGDGSTQKLNAMAASDGAVVAVGSDTTSPTPRPLFLFSPDNGDTWRLGTVEGAAATATVQRVVGGDGLWLASGGDETGTERGLWTSSDGEAWTAVAADGLAAFHKGDYVHDLARTASGFVATGRTTRQDGSAGPAAWRSEDGTTWERADLRGLRTGELKAVVARDDTVVALAQPSEGAGSRVVRSADGGRTWQATGFHLPEAMPRAGSLAVLPDRFALVPLRRPSVDGKVRVYCSPDGSAWSQCGSIGGLGGQGPGVESVISHDGGLAVVTRAGLEKYTVLASSDAREWTRHADLGQLSGASLRGFAMADGTLFAGGDRAAADVDNQPVLMSAPETGTGDGRATRVDLSGVEGLNRVARETTRVAQAGGRYVAVGAASGDAGIWTSPDWKNWTSAAFGGPRRQVLNDVVHGGRGWLAVGATQSGTATTDPLLVTSADGKEWKRVDAPGRADDHPYLDVRAAAAGEKGYVLAGEDRSTSGTASAAIWFSSDLKTFTRSRKLPRDGADARVHDVAANPGGYVAVGGTGTGEAEQAVVWTAAADGLDWTQRPRLSPPGAGASVLRQVVAHRGGLVATGAAQVDGERRPFAAYSADGGENWEYSWLPADEAAAVHDLAAGKGGLVAVGWHGVPGTGDSAAWVSPDGRAWNRQDPDLTRLSGDGMQWLAAVSVKGAEVAALGRSTTYASDHLTLWSSKLVG